MKTIECKNVYVMGKSAVGGPMEAKGPLGKHFDKTYDDVYAMNTSYEKAEIAMVYDACDLLFRKVQIQKEKIDLVIGGDLINQLAVSHYFARDLNTSFIGMYAACATSSLIIGQAALWIDSKQCNHALCFTSSHNNSAERQFRYPNEYGVQKKETTTYTVTGAGAMLLSNTPTNIKIKAFSIGEIVDWNFKNANDMGKAMAPAAFETIVNHLHNRKQQFSNYDLIVTGDLSKIGFTFLTDLFYQHHINIDNRLYDCGLMIYNPEDASTFCGGSGCACSMCVSICDLLRKLEKGEYKRILVVATGALLSPVMLQQKESIPCIAHAIEYEWSDIK